MLHREAVKEVFQVSATEILLSVGIQTRTVLRQLPQNASSSPLDCEQESSRSAARYAVNH